MIFLIILVACSNIHLVSKNNKSYNDLENVSIEKSTNVTINNSNLLNNTFDAAVKINDEVYFFRKNEYLKYDIASNGVDPGYPLPISDPTSNWDGFPSDWTEIDDAVQINNKVYFFNGSEYLKYDIASHEVDPGYPLPISYWVGFPSDWTEIDAAVNIDNKVYFFRKNQYLKYDIASQRVDPGYPLPISYWSGFPSDWTEIDAAVNFGNGKIYFFRKKEYLRYDIASQKVDVIPGFPYPARIAVNWKGVPASWLSLNYHVSDIFVSHQGVCFDSQYVYTIDTEKIYKRDLDLTVIPDNNKSLSDYQLYKDVENKIEYPDNEKPNHFGDGCQYGDYLYIPVEYYKNKDNMGNCNILKISKADLELEDQYQITKLVGPIPNPMPDTPFEISGIGTDGNFLYVVSYHDGSKVWKYDLDGKYNSVITLRKVINNIQGIAINTKYNEMYISDDENKEIVVFDMDGNYLSTIYKIGNKDGNITIEGLDTVDDEIKVLIETYPPNLREDRLHYLNFIE